MVISILPRLDEFDRRRHRYSHMIQNVTEEMGARYMDMVAGFPTTNSWLWCRDGLHISEDWGLPKLVGEMAQSATDFANEPSPKQRPKPISPEWMWRKLRQHNPLGKYVSSSVYQWALINCS